MNSGYQIPTLPLVHDLETRATLRQATKTSRALAELKGLASTIPNEQILISTLTLQEAKESSEVENIVTTQDDLYQADLQLPHHLVSIATKEVLNYREAIQYGFNLIKEDKILSTNKIKAIQRVLVDNGAGFRSVPGTHLKDNHGNVVYTPPQDAAEIEHLMKNLEAFINDDSLADCDPLIKMAIIHHQFESIHPFFDGNGRTGRIINILYLVINELLDLPILYLSRYITRNKTDYYRLIQSIRDQAPDNHREWEAWVLFILTGIEETAHETIRLVEGIARLMQEFKTRLKPIFGKQYRHELLNNLFFHPYTKIDFLSRDLSIQRKTATKYLDRIVEEGLLSKIKIWRENYYINTPLVELFVNHTSNSSSSPHIEP